MARKKQANPKKSKGKQEAFVYKKQKPLTKPLKGRKIGDKSKRNLFIKKRKIKDLSLHKTLKEQYEADQEKDDEWTARVNHTYPEQVRAQRERDTLARRRADRTHRRANIGQSENNPEQANGTYVWPSDEVMGFGVTLSTTTIGSNWNT